jgi:hypothetical protein
MVSHNADITAMSDNKRGVKDYISRVPGTALQSLPGITVWWLGRGIEWVGLTISVHRCLT